LDRGSRSPRPERFPSPGTAPQPRGTPTAQATDVSSAQALSKSAPRGHFPAADSSTIYTKKSLSWSPLTESNRRPSPYQRHLPLNLPLTLILSPTSRPPPERAFDLEFDVRLTSTDEVKVTVLVPEVLLQHVYRRPGPAALTWNMRAAPHRMVEVGSSCHRSWRRTEADSLQTAPPSGAICR
jgi:hypothetical protein